MNNLKLLVIAQDSSHFPRIRDVLHGSFGPEITVVSVHTRREALSKDLKSFDLILSDDHLLDATGLEMLSSLRTACETPVIMVTDENVARVAAEAIRKGAADYIVKTENYFVTIPVIVEKNLIVAKIKRENEQLRGELETVLKEMCEKNAQLERSLSMLEELAATDPLTGLYNRRHFAKVVDQLFAEAQRYDNDMSCLMIDVDHYKTVNDTLGHQMGDQLLILTAKVINTNLRRMDVAARYGGDEFVLLLPHAAAVDAVVVAQRIGKEFKRATAALLNRADGMTLSIGVGSIVINIPHEADHLITAADKALYRAKESGRDQVNLWDKVVSILG